MDLRGNMYQSIKASAISLKPTKWDKASNAEKLEAFFVEAAKDAPQLILATEGVLEGYVVMDVIEGRATPEAMLEIAEPIDGTYIRRFRRLARQLKTCLCFGFAERCGTSSVYNSAVLLTPTETSAAPITKRSSPRERTHCGTSTASAKQFVRLIHLSDVPAF